MPTLSTLVGDGFDRPDGSDLGSPWDVITSVSAFNISGNTAVPSSLAADCGERRNDVNPGADQWAEAAITVTGSPADTSLNGAGVCVRMSPTAETGYILTATNDRIKMFRVVAGAATFLVQLLLTWTNGDRLRFEAVGSRLAAYINNVERLVTTDTQITGGGFPGIFYGSTTATAAVNDFAAGSFGVPEAIRQPVTQWARRTR